MKNHNYWKVKRYPIHFNRLKNSTENKIFSVSRPKSFKRMTLFLKKIFPPTRKELYLARMKKKCRPAPLKRVKHRKKKKRNKRKKQKNHHKTKKSNGISHRNFFSFLKSTLGWKYRFGGNSPGGVDCSGYVYYFLKHCGIDIPRVSSRGLLKLKQGRKISIKSVKPGDILFFATGGDKKRVSHVGICTSNSPIRFIHSPKKGRVVCMTGPAAMKSYWLPRLKAARRFIEVF
ncbi:C40 family peptidase [Candidatus Riflebacteria bacterium]